MERRLSAILVADMVGYSRLMERDEAGTLARQLSYRSDVIDPSFDQHSGRIFKTTGDGLLAEFPSVVDAVQCAIDIQRQLVDREADQPDELRIQYRIGINLGDVMHQDGDVFGDGVNVAARLEQMAEAGGICISGAAYDQLHSTIDAGYEDLGLIQVKNISRPIHAWRVLLDPSQVGQLIAAPKRSGRLMPALIGAAALLILAAGAYWWSERPDFEPVSKIEMAEKLPDGPSIAVLPFDYFGADEAENDFMADGLTENLTAYLAKIPELLVVARNSAAAFKGQDVDVREVSKQFGVRYVLEGSLQKSGDDIRVTAQLIDAVDGKHLWAETYDRGVEDLFRIQDEITLHISREVLGEALEGDQSARHGTKNIAAFVEYMKGRRARLTSTVEAFRKSAGHFQKALALDPNYTDALAELGFLIYFPTRILILPEPDREERLSTAENLIQQALTIDPDHAPALSRLAVVRNAQRRFDEARDLVARSTKLAPNDVNIIFAAAYVSSYIGDVEIAFGYFERFYALRPPKAYGYAAEYPIALTVAKRCEEAIPLSIGVYDISPPSSRFGWAWMVFHCFWETGDQEEARVWLQKILDENPKASIQELLSNPFWRLFADDGPKNRAVSYLQAAGVPEAAPAVGVDEDQ